MARRMAREGTAAAFASALPPKQHLIAVSDASEWTQQRPSALPCAAVAAAAVGVAAIPATAAPPRSAAAAAAELPALSPYTHTNPWPLTWRTPLVLMAGPMPGVTCLRGVAATAAAAAAASAAQLERLEALAAARRATSGQRRTLVAALHAAPAVHAVLELFVAAACAYARGRRCDGARPGRLLLSVDDDADRVAEGLGFMQADSVVVPDHDGLVSGACLEVCSCGSSDGGGGECRRCYATATTLAASARRSPPPDAPPDAVQQQTTQQQQQQQQLRLHDGFYASSRAAARAATAPAAAGEAFWDGIISAQERAFLHKLNCALGAFGTCALPSAEGRRKGFEAALREATAFWTSKSTEAALHRAP
ncbi:hypothetical protein JKP88DRAFT_294607 [Tribonema minus]|uniref:Uncharacterized protein n=1 Tax=Tribonema minus TaxID=303371 RepID=A0A835ZCJ8_9STRA|nr:hypothetical protein JKP88DRAFT_294607 [Tribonema minus]